MRRLLCGLVFLMGCVVPMESEQEEDAVLDDMVEGPDSSNDEVKVEPCASAYERTLGGKVIEIPIECHPLDLPIFWWGPDDYERPMDELEFLQQPEVQR